jgi:hypothetical protein
MARSPKWSLPFRYSVYNFVAFVISHMCATCPARLILFGWFSLIIICEYYKLWSSSLCIFLYYPVPVLSTLFLNILNLCYSLRASSYP